jgi:hypothetical protein
MSAWGENSSARSCDVLLKRVEVNDPGLEDLIILPIKSFGSKELSRLAQCLGQNSHLRSLQASGHSIESVEAIEAFGSALASSSLVEIAIGDSNMGDHGINALCRGLESSGNILGLKRVDFSWKGM